MKGSGSRKWPIIATVAVLTGLAAGATAVALVGSAQRRDDRAAYLRYERALLPSLREGGRIVQQEMKPSLRALPTGEISRSVALERAASWREEFNQVLRDVTALSPPSFLGDVERRWVATIDAYRSVADLFAQSANLEGADRTLLLDRAATAGARADDLFDGASSVMQFHRHRLGLGSTSSLPNPTAT